MTLLRYAAVSAFALVATPLFAADEFDFFEKKIRPVLVENCYACHSEQAPKIKAGLKLDTRDGLLKGGDSGPALVAGDPANSRIIKVLKYAGPHMPPKGRLPDNIVSDFEKWIKDGAADPRVATPQAVVKKNDMAEAKKYWAFQPPKAHATPAVKDKNWTKSPIDNFILAKLDAAGLQPAASAEPRTLLRRVYFDLIGLPPTPEEMEHFLNDYAASPRGSIEKTVDRLLESKQFGERWARLWLDVVRYAEDQAHIVGSDASLTYPNAYLYRDWVIDALNKDMPYDRFVQMQLAADLVAPNEQEYQAALGFMGLGPKYYSRNRLDVMTDEWEDRVDITGRALLGLTLACARCHDHKFDPIPTTDYHALAGVFASTSMFNKPLSDKVEKKDKSDDAKAPKDAMHIVKEGTATDLNVFVRGNVENKGPQVKRHFLTVLSEGEPKPFTKGSGRAELAEAIIDPKNPLTARVIVNRVWAAHFGKGIVGTASNFGSLGDKPSHPELLDDLAVRFMQNGWSLKWLHREMVLSAAYQQSSESTSKKRTVDADNKLLSRMPRQRLSVEAWRDTLLLAAGTLDRTTVGGKSIDPLDPKQTRRTVYSMISRLELNRLLSLFDFPDPNQHSSKRSETTTPLQKLFVLNSPFMIAQADGLADRLAREITGTDPEVDRRRIERAYELLYSRPAGEKEVAVGLKFLSKPGDRAANWKQYAHMLLAANEMMFVD